VELFSTYLITILQRHGHISSILRHLFYGVIDLESRLEVI